MVVNDRELGQADITFVDDGGQLRLVLTPGQLAEYGVNVSAFPAFQALHEGETFTRIEKFIPDASSRFSFANQRLTLSIPQAAMNCKAAAASIRRAGTMACRPRLSITIFPARK
ncbi:FimD/PapC N-terminal domain-containing protein [Klebsiella pneumoniae subsp. pneumoniae]|nr:FimD/PapC N-terminal domain-containing protein [Klebsiella pneumoniae subsp. pneumoniae]